MKKKEIENHLNRLGSTKTPTLFIINFDISRYYIKPLAQIDNDILYNIEDIFTNSTSIKKRTNINYSFEAVNYQRYKRAFDIVQENIKSGNSYLLNLTFPSQLKIDKTLKEIYLSSDAKYKLYFKDKFICFSPEKFIEIIDNKIYTYPMKGTIDAKIKNAKDKILSNQKEMAEHVMVVDLLRNDLNMVSKGVKVEKFRYIDKIKAGERELLQVSSKISGELEKGWQNRLGTILTTLLPAGSISGTPKKKTIEIIKKVEQYKRDYFTGIFGIFDGKNLKSAVMIRFIEKIDEKLYYKSGGGITIDSNPKAEYNELKEKIYIPFFK